MSHRPTDHQEGSNDPSLGSPNKNSSGKKGAGSSNLDMVDQLNYKDPPLPWNMGRIGTHNKKFKILEQQRRKNRNASLKSLEQGFASINPADPENTQAMVRLPSIG
mmetsp:Transcript_38870/g.59070  ORF Transcript_38870/g.59070 Transcript_38870/m.59070 type:complete len:106 (+) Transcript_38870:1237-1554(+)